MIDFAGPIQSSRKKTRTRYIIIVMEYLTRCVEAHPVKYCTSTMIAKFLFEYVLTRFGCLKVLMSDRGTHCVNEMIIRLTEEF